MVYILVGLVLIVLVVIFYNKSKKQKKETGIYSSKGTFTITKKSNEKERRGFDSSSFEINSPLSFSSDYTTQSENNSFEFSGGESGGAGATDSWDSSDSGDSGGDSGGGDGGGGGD